nr:MAG TPA: minor tail protein [Caudoviricetes sp.]
MAADGSVIIDTRIDTSNIKSGVYDIKQSFGALSGKVKQISSNITSFFSKSSVDTVKVVKTENAKINAILEDTSKSAKQKAALIASIYRKEGYSASEAFATAWSHIERSSSGSTARVKKHIRGIGNQSKKTSDDMQREFSTGFSNVASSASSKLKRIALLIGSAFAVGKLIQFGKESIELGSDLAEVQNVVDVTFTTMSDKVNEFAKNAMTSAGLSETMAKRYVGTFGAMSKSFGFSEAQAYDMSTALTQLTGDVASFYNISQDLAYIKLKSVFTGETETLKDLGVVMTQSALDQYALANGYGKTTSAMTEQEKVALRLAFVQKQLSAASGDFIRTSDSWANQVRVMQLQLQSLKATVGQGLINIFTPVLKVINILLGKLATLANAFKSFTELITGRKSSGQTSGSGAGLAGTDTVADTADQYGQAADNAEKMADATNDNAKATKKANKETKSYLSSLDEIKKATSTGSNSSSTPSSSSGSGGAGNSGLPSSVGNVDYGNLAEGETALDKISDSAKKLADLLKKLWKPFQDAWKKEGKNTIDAANIALSGIAKLAKSVGKSLVEVWTNGTGTTMLTTMLRIAQNVLKTIGNIASGFADAWNKNNVGTQIIQNIADALVVVMQFVEKIAEDTATWAANLDFYPLLESISNLTSTFAPILESIGNVLEWIYDNIVLPMLKWVIEVGLPTVVNLVSSLVGFFADHQSIIEAFGAALIGAFAAAKIAGLASKIAGSITTVASFTKGLIALMTGSGGIMGGIKAIATAIGPGGIFISAVTACIAIGVLLYKNWDKIKEVAGKVWDWIKSKTLTFVSTISSGLKNLASKIVTIWDNIKSSAYQKWTAIWSTVGGLVGKIKDGIVEKFVSAKDKVIDTFEGIKNKVKEIFNKVIGIVNGAIGTVNGAISGIESAFSFGPWKVPTPFGKKTIGFSATFPRVPTVPYLAKGAVIPPRSEFLAVLGDQKNGRNLEAPEGVIKDIIDDAFARHQQNSTGNVRFTAQINRRTVFDEIIEEAKLRRSTSGRNPFELA